MGDGTKSNGFRDIIDGSTNTILLVEAKRSIPWTKPEDIAVPSVTSLPAFGGFTNDGYHVGMCDGVARFIQSTIDATPLQNAVNRRDGNPVILAN